MIVLIINEEDFLAERFLKSLLEKYLDAATRDFNFDRVSARDTSLDRVADLCRTPPMMAASRTIVVDDFELALKKAVAADDTDTPSSPAKRKKTVLADAFMAYLASPLAETHLILVARGADRRSRLYKAVAAAGTVHEFKRPYEDKLPAFVAEQARFIGLTISSEAAEHLAEVAGPELGSLAGELEKLLLYVHPRKAISLNDVESLAAQGAAVNVFALGETLARRNLSDSLRLYRRMAEQGEVAVKIQALLITHFRKLLLICEAIDAKRQAGDAELASCAGVSPYFIKGYRAQLKLTNQCALRKNYSRLMQLSTHSRLTGMSESAQMEDFVVQVCVG